MKYYVLTMQLALLCGVCAYPVQAATPAGKAMLKALKPTHPRLLLTDERLAQVKRQAESDPLLAKVIEDVVKRAERRLVETRPLNVGRSREIGRKLIALAAGWRLTGRKEFADKAVADMLAAGQFESWGGGFLNTSGLSLGMAIAYDWLYGAMDQPTRERVRTAIVEKGLREGLKAYAYDPPAAGWWTRKIHNWNNVCNGGMVVAALAVGDTDPDVAGQVLDETMLSMPFALDAYDASGAWQEGPGYWDYATRYTAYALTAMQTALGSDFGLSDRAGLAGTGWYCIYNTGPTGLSFNYADSGSRPGAPPLMFWLADRYNEPAFAAWTAERRTDRAGSVGDLCWYPLGGIKPTAGPRPLDKLFRGTMDVMFMRSSWDDPDALFVGVKGGFNQSNHGNLDLGTFVLDALGVRWARDLGGDSYGLEDYFDFTPAGKRWTYYRCGSLSHNVPALDNTNQHPMAVAGITEYKITPARSFVVWNLTPAYGRFADRVLRGVEMMKGRRAVLIQDEFDLIKPCEVAWGMTTRAEIETKGSVAILTEDGKEMRVTAIEPAGAEFTVESAEQEPPENTNRGFRRLMLRVNAKAGSTRVAVLFSPVWPDGKVSELSEVTPLDSWR